MTDISSLYRKYIQSGKVSTDTRNIAEGSVFFALRGPRFNANEFAADAIAKGAAWAVVDDMAYCKDDRFIFAEDTLIALQMLAKFHREQLTIPVIGLTGSNGKTTSKELLQTVLSARYKTSATKGNLNNHIGVPLTLLDIDSSCEIAVVEMGANHVGEIAALCAIANPTHGFITNIGRAHIGEFGGVENILRAKSELYQHLIARDGTVFINSQNPVLSNMARRFRKPFFYPAPGDYYHCELIGTDPCVRIRTENGNVITTQLTGNYNFENIAAALCIAKYFEVNPDQAGSALQQYTPGNMRSQIIQTQNNRVILDAYNANPSSMEAAIDNLASLNGERKAAILGDMYELGEDAAEEHRRLGLLLQNKGIQEVYFCGELIRSAMGSFPSGHYFEKPETLKTYLKQHPIINATILVKASRGMKLEQVMDVL